MTKPELVNAIAEKTGLKKKDVDEVMNAFVEAVIDDVAAGNKVQIVGFGTFETAERSAREGRNPRTGEALSIAATKLPKFKAGKTFKDRVNG